MREKINRDEIETYIRFEDISSEELILKYGECHWESEPHCEPMYCMYWKVRIKDVDVYLQWLQSNWLCIGCKLEDIEKVFGFFEEYHKKPYLIYSRDSGEWLKINTDCAETWDDILEWGRSKMEQFNFLDSLKELNAKRYPYPSRKETKDGREIQDWLIETEEAVELNLELVSKELSDSVLNESVNVLIQQGYEERIPNDYKDLFSLKIDQLHQKKLVFSCTTSRMLNGDIVYPMRLIQEFYVKYNKIVKIQNVEIEEWEGNLFYSSLKKEKEDFKDEKND